MQFELRFLDLRFWQEIKGFNKRDFREISKWYPQYSTTVVTTEYLKYNLSLIITVPI
jgi:hypothetical protein